MTSRKQQYNVYYLILRIRYIYIYVCDRIAFKWFVKSNQRNLESTVGINVKELLTELHVPLRKKERIERSNITLEREIQQRKFPTGGLNQLQVPVEEGLQWARGLTAEDFHDEDTLREFMKHFYSSLYTHNPAGKYI